MAVRWCCNSVARNLRSIQTGFRSGDRNCGRCSDSVDRIRKLTDGSQTVARCDLPMIRRRWDHRRYRWAGHYLKWNGIRCPIAIVIGYRRLSPIGYRIENRSLTESRNR